MTGQFIPNIGSGGGERFEIEVASLNVMFPTGELSRDDEEILGYALRNR